ncbi:MAG: murein biosynthesis integral membrane protein MurJ, partial [Opitutales bacterium]
ALLNKVLTRLLGWLTPVVAVCCLLAWLAGDGWITDAKWAHGVELVAITLPYLILICLTAMIVATLNVRQRFGAGACTPILLNLAMISTLLWFGSASGEESPNLDFLAFVLCGGVLVGGGLQLLVPSVNLARAEGWRPRVDWAGSDALSKVWVLFLPGVLGAAVLQINVLVSRTLAYSLEEEGVVSILFLAARLIELPLGVFAIAVTTVVFPLLAKMRSQDDEAGYLSAFEQGLRLTLAVTLPAAVGLVLLRDPILGLLFDWGRFGADDVGRTAPVLAIVAIGMPFFATAAFVTRGFHARKDMRTPVRGAVVSLGVNMVISVASVLYLGEWAMLGLASANVLAGMFQSAYLLSKFAASEGKSPFGLRLGLGSIGMACLLLGLAAWGGWEWISSMVEMSPKARFALAVFAVIPVSAGLYFLFLGRLGFPDAALLRNMVMPRGR